MSIRTPGIISVLETLIEKGEKRGGVFTVLGAEQTGPERPRPPFYLSLKWKPNRTRRHF